MEENKVQSKESNQLTYEQLKAVCQQLSNQNEQLYAKINEINLVNTFKRLDYLFKVLENDVSFDEKFVGDCAEEIKNIMTPPVEKSTEVKPEEK